MRSLERVQQKITTKMIKLMRKICVYTSTRAEYGIMRNLIREIHACLKLELQLLVSGSHLNEEQGMTVDEILTDEFIPTQCIDIALNDDSPSGVCHSMGIAISEYGKFFVKYTPDILVVLGDRFEAFCCASAAHVCRIPIAHIHGGETTEGAIDEAFRHSITKMSNFHFPSHDEYRKRIIQMGEPPETVFEVGGLSVENMKKMTLISKEELEKSINFRLDRPFFLITFHPVTLEENTSGIQFNELLKALDKFRDHKMIFTQANSDPNSHIINTMITQYAKENSNRCLAVPSLGSQRYFSAMRLCEAVIGNSSSGVLEAPVFNIPSVNIGDRQKGRIRFKSIIDCDPDLDSMVSAVEKAIQMKNQISNQFTYQKTAHKIIYTLRNANLKNIKKKTFHDF